MTIQLESNLPALPVLFLFHFSTGGSVMCSITKFEALLFSLSLYRYGVFLLSVTEMVEVSRFVLLSLSSLLISAWSKVTIKCLTQPMCNIPTGLPELSNFSSTSSIFFLSFSFSLFFSFLFSRLKKKVLLSSLVCLLLFPLLQVHSMWSFRLFDPPALFLYPELHHTHICYTEFLCSCLSVAAAAFGSS